MTYLIVPDLQQGFIDLAHHVATHGAPVAPRGLATHELLAATLEFPDPTNLLPVYIGRRLSVPFNAASAPALVAGADCHDLLTRIAPAFAALNADGVDREGYGPKTRSQVSGCVRRLSTDPFARDAIITLQPPRTDSVDGGRVFPCTSSIQFLVREGALVMLVSMRSNDVIKGLSGDAWTFSQLHRTLAWVLGLRTGTYYHRAASLHIYDEDLPRLADLHAPTRPGPDVDGFAGECHAWDPLTRLASARGRALSVLQGGPGQPWYETQMARALARG